ncbi:MAG TPA: SGNH/GDSL hydrolase family protein [Terracidiphilus sp.]|nr:SGNH/GDSL hydrolase family protein [Terracidiphilus sp.]
MRFTPDTVPVIPVSSSPSQTSLRLRSILCVAAMLVFSLGTALAQAGGYTTIVVFGDSLSDTGNVTHLTFYKYGIPVPGPYADYTLGSFTDGPDTTPAAQNYFGVWVQQLAAAMPGQPEIIDSLDGGTNYAYGYATTGSGTSTLTFPDGTPNPPFVQIHNIGQQITDYLATHPKIDSHTLFIIWGGAIDLLDAKSATDVINAAIRQTLNIQRLVNAGATQFLVPNLPPLGLTPRLNGSLATSVPANAAALLFNAYLATGLAVLHDFYPFRRLVFMQLDVFSLFKKVVSTPGAFSLANVTQPSQGNPLADPDQYLFWDDLHPTTRGHNILAETAGALVAQHLAAVR